MKTDFRQNQVSVYTSYGAMISASVSPSCRNEIIFNTCLHHAEDSCYSTYFRWHVFPYDAHYKTGALKCASHSREREAINTKNGGSPQAMLLPLYGTLPIHTSSGLLNKNENRIQRRTIPSSSLILMDFASKNMCCRMNALDGRNKSTKREITKPWRRSMYFFHLLIINTNASHKWY